MPIKTKNETGYSIRNVNTKFKKDYNGSDFSQNCEDKAKSNLPHL